MFAWIKVIGITEDGIASLHSEAQQALQEAEFIYGSQRQLDLVTPLLGIATHQQIRTWPIPFSQVYQEIVALKPHRVCVLASGDPMHYGVGNKLAKFIPMTEMHIIPAVSSLSLAASRLGWALEDTTVIPLHGRPLECMNRELFPQARLLLMAENKHSLNAVSNLLQQGGYGQSRICVLERLGGPHERIAWTQADNPEISLFEDLAILGVECIADDTAHSFAHRSVLPDDCWTHQGQITKQEVRAAVLMRLAPLPGQLLWDIGAGSGSIGIEWMRSDARCRAIAIEPRADRCALIRTNSLQLGVPELVVVQGCAPDALTSLATPDAIFIGGGLTTPTLPELCWSRLPKGGRLVATAVTLESAQLLYRLQQELGGSLTQITISQAMPLGDFTAWQPQRPIVLFACEKN